jgi:ribonuclease Z
MKLTILGSSASTPKINKHTTSQLLKIKSQLILIDCGEGIQMQLRKLKISFSRINHIFISHLHGDHYFGLIGLISTFRLLGRTNDLNIYGPEGLEELINLQLKLSRSWLNYKVIFQTLKSKNSKIIYNSEDFIVKTIPLNHRIYTNGFLFEEKFHKKNINISKVEEYNLDINQIKKNKKGEDVFLEDGKRFANRTFLKESKKSKKYAFCSDTAYYKKIIELIESVDCLYHESTFLDSHAELAKKTKHSTASDAAKIASLANVGKLILGHFSNRYRNQENFLMEARIHFKNVELAIEGTQFDI